MFELFLCVATSAERGMSLILCSNVFDGIGFYWCSKQPQRRLIVYGQAVLLTFALTLVSVITLTGSYEDTKVSIPWAHMTVDQNDGTHDGIYNGRFRVGLRGICQRSLNSSLLYYISRRKH